MDLRYAASLAAWWYGMPWQSAMKLSIKEIGGRKIVYRNGTSDEAVLDHSFNRDIFLTGVPEYQPRSSDTVLDVGAHLGDFSLLVSTSVARVFALEPCGDTYSLLRTNIRINDQGNIKADRIALSGANGSSKLFYAPPGESWGDSTMFAKDYHTGRFEVVDTYDLATYMQMRGIDRIDFAKFNCEGAEFGILLSASLPTLRRIKMMLILYHCDFCEEHNEQELISHLQAAGFDIEVRNRTKLRGWIVAHSR